MKNRETCRDVQLFQEWRVQLENSLGLRRETLLELLDSLSSNQQATSVVELSLNPLFRRDYNSLYKGIQEFLPQPTSEKYETQVNLLLEAISLTLPRGESRDFNLLGIDTTPLPRPYSPTLADKTYIYHPNPIKGNKPINIGHTYSVVSALPDRQEAGNVPWTIPLLGDRVPAEAKAIDVGNQQLKTIFQTSLFGGDKLSILVADSLYSQREFIGEQVKRKNLVVLTRVRSNRVFYRAVIPEINEPKTSGHPRWYGDKFDLKDERTWPESDEVTQATFNTKKGRQLTVTISCWKQMLMKGTKNYQMNRHPFSLLQITVRDEIGNLVWKPMWLIVVGSRCHELSLIDCYESYRQRYDLEHLFRFGKQKLLMTAYATPDVHHEENWFKLTLLAYVNLWAARNLATVLPRPWEKYLTQNKSLKVTPSLVQRDFGRIISQIGTIAQSPKHRGYSPGRFKGYKKDPRTRHQVIRKTKKVVKEKLKDS